MQENKVNTDVTFILGMVRITKQTVTHPKNTLMAIINGLVLISYITKYEYVFFPLSIDNKPSDACGDPDERSCTYCEHQPPELA